MISFECAQKFKLRLFCITQFSVMLLFIVLYKVVLTFESVDRNLRGSDCKYRESADKFKKSKILITCQKNTFGELSSKILLKPSGIL